MNYTQNEKIEQVNRERELTKRVFSFRKDMEEFNSFNPWVETLKNENSKTAVLIGY